MIANIARLEQLASACLTDEDCPPAERIAAYALGRLSGTEQLSIAAHIRQCPLCTADVLACRPPPNQRSTIIARLLPLLAAEGRRGSLSTAHVRQYVAADLTIELTIPPPLGDFWRVTGQVLRDANGVPNVQIVLRTKGKRYQQMSDAQGFFTFDQVLHGRYSLTAEEGTAIIRIRDLVLEPTPS